MSKFVNAKHKIVSFVNNCIRWNRAGEFLNYFHSSFNLSLVVRNSKTSEYVLIHFLFPGKVYKPWQERKVKSKVIFIKYLSESTSIPIPCVYYWGLAKKRL